MGISESERCAIAGRIRNAERHGTTIGPITATDDIDLDEAYRVQAAVVDGPGTESREPRGHKVGLTGDSAQNRFGAEEPIYGRLIDDRLWEPGMIPEAPLHQPAVEAEMAFVLEKTLPTDSDIATVREAVAAVRPAIEVVSGRIVGESLDVADLVADNARFAGCVLGRPEMAVDDFDRESESVTVSVDDEPEATGIGANVLGDPLRALEWLSGTDYGQSVNMERGDIVLAGSLVTPVAVKPGQSVEVTFKTLGSVTLELAS